MSICFGIDAAKVFCVRYTESSSCQQFLSNKEEEQNEQEELKKKLMDAQKGQVKCRLCKEDHWTKQCPYKDKLEPLRSSLLVSLRQNPLVLSQHLL